MVTSTKQIRVFFTNFEVLFFFFFNTLLFVHNGIYFSFLRCKLPALVLNTGRINLLCRTVIREVPWPSN